MFWPLQSPYTLPQIHFPRAPRGCTALKLYNTVPTACSGVGVGQVSSTITQKTFSQINRLGATLFQGHL